MNTYHVANRRNWFGCAFLSLLSAVALPVLIPQEAACQATGTQPTSSTQPVTVAASEEPRIFSTFPAIGAKDVDPSITEISVTFNQDMGGGMSWTGGGPEFPKGPEGKRAVWKDKRTCVLPVTLEPGKYYRLGINAPSFQNFRSISGVAVTPCDFYFTTKGGNGNASAQMQKPVIVKMEPANGATGVSPAIKELRVTFSTEMGGGCSWTGGGPNFPEIPQGAKVQWTPDHKTCILPVSLKPNWKYQLGVNSPSFKNFKSASGISSDPVVYTFSTGQ